ncbi:MAG: hypothetical protein ACRYE9_03035 [Janthinobacterium lividum]
MKYNRIDNSGAAASAEALTINSFIIIVDLRINSISDIGVEVLAKALMVNCSIVNMYLQDNKIGKEGATALEVNRSLKALDLENKIGQVTRVLQLWLRL